VNDDKSAVEEAGISTPAMDVAVAAIILAVGALVVFDSHRLGSSWGDDGPQSGYFPFYIGLLLCISSIATLAQVAFDQWKRSDQFKGVVAERRSQFVAWSQLKLVFSVLVPAAVYVLLVEFFGFYVASAVYITLFMVWLGKYPWPKSVAIGFCVSASIFLMFEVWFKVPLYKGAYDMLSWLGY
jgi:Tripartite tricarboxylate transporter TctB family